MLTLFVGGMLLVVVVVGVVLALVLGARFTTGLTDVIYGLVAHHLDKAQARKEGKR